MKHFGRTFALFTILIAFLLIPVSAATALIPGGQVVAMQLSDGTITIAAIDETLGKNAKAAGLRSGDQILAVEGRSVSSPEEIRSVLAATKGAVELSIRRAGKEQTLQFTPAMTENGPRLGVYLKEGTAGIGTITYYDPKTTTFGALGHGVNTPKGKPVSMKTGQIYEATVLSVKKGKIGTPGQLVGAIADPDGIGNLSKNTARGVFGKTAMPDLDPIPVGQAKAGKATIRSTIDQQGLREYSVEIMKIYPGSSKDGRNMLIKVTDPALLEATGGIVQGMSGSPIIQEGKLVGAVTHVLVNDPTTGYGIFIDNMLDAA